MRLTQERLKEVLVFFPEVGNFFWKKSGALAGTLLKDGRIQIQVDNHFYKAHRLAWLYMYGVFPSKQLDHINRIPYDNRLDNLREVTQSQNLENQIKAKSHNSSGLLGVSYDKQRKKYCAYITTQGRRKFLGRFTTAEEAHSRYLIEKEQLHTFYTKVL